MFKAWARVYLGYITDHQDLQGNIPEIPKEWLDVDEEESDDDVEEVKEEEDEEEEVKIGVIETAISYAIDANEGFKRFSTNNSNKEFMAQPIVENLITLAELYNTNGLNQGFLEKL